MNILVPKGKQQQKSIPASNLS